jgi:hypothetical protein
MFFAFVHTPYRSVFHSNHSLKESNGKECLSDLEYKEGHKETPFSVYHLHRLIRSTSGSLSFHITAYQLRWCPVVKLRVMSRQNYGVDLHCLGVLNHASLNWHTVWVIHPEEGGFYVSALLLASYCKLLQILMSSQEKKLTPTCSITFP